MGQPFACAEESLPLDECRSVIEVKGNAGVRSKIPARDCDDCRIVIDRREATPRPSRREATRLRRQCRCQARETGPLASMRRVFATPVCGSEAIEKKVSNFAEDRLEPGRLEEAIVLMIQPHDRQSKRSRCYYSQLPVHRFVASQWARMSDGSCGVKGGPGTDALGPFLVVPSTSDS